MSRDSLIEARRRERLSQAAWRRQRAEVARLVAAGEEEAARKLLAQAGAETDEPAAWESSLEAGDDSSAPQLASVVAGPEEAPSGTATRQPEVRPPSTGKPAFGNPTRKPARRVPRRQTWAVWFRERPPWVVSLATHGALLTLFGLLSFATLAEPDLSLTATLGEDRSFDSLPTPITLEESLPEADEPPSLSEPLVESLDLAVDVPLESLVEPVSFEPLADLGELLTADALSASATGETPAQSKGDEGASDEGDTHSKRGGRVSFFGAESEAARVVFVVDNSGSMQHGRMETTLFELERAVGRLAKEQEFYVVFFSDQAYPMFFPQGVDHAMPATRDNKRRLSAWLRTVEICLGGRLLDAMELAAGLEPDVVYLLTDGDIRSERIAGRMTERGAWPFTIHTLGMGARRPQHAQLLSRIAANAGGVYRPVGANPQAVASSRQRPIPYRREPGAVWGSAVTPWR